MKRFLLVMVFTLLLFPGFAQDSNQAAIAVDEQNVPQKVKDAVSRDFGNDLKINWAASSHKFANFGWEEDSSLPMESIYYYTIHTKLNKGSEIDAVYTPDGKLIRSREKLEDFEPPKNILASLEKGPYKDWKIEKDAHFIKDNEGRVQEHYALKLQNGSKKKTLYFDKNGNLLSNRARK